MAKSKAKKVGVSVSIQDSHFKKMDSVKSGLEEAGLEVNQVLGAAGVITGTIAPSDISKLNQVPGVSAVEKSEDYQIAPPDSDVQ